jgi:hypothetical protein
MLLGGRRRGSVKPPAVPEPDASRIQKKMSSGIRNVSAANRF